MVVLHKMPPNYTNNATQFNYRSVLHFVPPLIGRSVHFPVMPFSLQHHPSHCYSCCYPAFITLRYQGIDSPFDGFGYTVRDAYEGVTTGSYKLQPGLNSQVLRSLILLI